METWMCMCMKLDGWDNGLSFAGMVTIDSQVYVPRSLLGCGEPV
jgi:hypothetical protein